MKKRGKKAQTSMEYLTTYGWIILVIGLVLAALISLNIFNPPKSPNKCDTQAPFSCKDVVFRPGGFEAIIGVKDLLSGNVVNAKINNEPCKLFEVVHNDIIGNVNLDNGFNTIRCWHDIDKIKEGDRVNAEVEINYTAELRGLVHRTKVLLTGEVEKSKYINYFDSSTILRMDFDNDNSSTALDNSYYKNHGVLTDAGSGIGKPQLRSSSCTSGSCYYFKPIISYQSYIDAGDKNILSLQIPSFTIEYWINMTRLYLDGSVSMMGIIDKLECYGSFPCSSYRGYSNTFNYSVDTENHIFRFNTNQFPGSGSTGPKFTRNIVDNQWHHIVSVKQGGNMYLYLDGDLVGTGTGSTPSLGNPPPRLIIGQYYDASGHGGFQGLMDNVIIYRRALTPEEIKQHYTQLKP